MGYWEADSPLEATSTKALQGGQNWLYLSLSEEFANSWLI
jgi:hypothetical protein